MMRYLVEPFIAGRTLTRVLTDRMSRSRWIPGKCARQARKPGFYAVEQLEQRLLLAQTPPLAFTEPDGDVAQVRLSGPGTVSLSDPDANGIPQLDLTGTDAATGSLSIAVKKAPAGNGLVALDAITGTGLKSLSAKAVDVVGAGINLGGLPTQKTTITLHVLGAGATLDVHSAISKLTAAAFGDATIVAPSIASLSIAGDKKLGIAGDFRADITLSGAGVAPGKLALGNVKIAGAADGIAVSVSGDIGTFSAARLLNSTVFARYVPADAAAPLRGGVFTPGRRINSLKASGIKGSAQPAFANSTIASANIGAVSLGSVAVDNPAGLFGVLASESIKSVAVANPAFRFDPNTPAPQGNDEFQILRGPNPPTITGFSTDSGTPGDGITNDTTPTIQGTAAPGSTVTVLLNGSSQGTTAAGANGTWSLTLSAQPDGIYTVTASARDAAGNASLRSGPLVVRIDATAPTTPTLGLDPASDTDPDGDDMTELDSVTLVGRTAPNMTVRLVQTGATTTSDGAGSFSFANVSLSLGANVFTVRATDPAGNTSEFTRSINRSGPPTGFMLAEETNFVVERTVPVQLGQESGTRKLRFDVTPQFDTTDTSAAAEDVFLVYLVDPANPSHTLLDRGTPGTSLFALAGGVTEMALGPVRFDGQTVEIDVTALGAITGGQLVFQLIGSDGDTGSSVSIGPVENVVDPEGVAGPVFPVQIVGAAIGPAVDLAGLNATADVKLVVENVRFDSDTNRYTADLSVRNNGSAIGRQVAVVFPGLPAGVTLVDPSGTDATGAPYVNFRDAIRAGGLASGATSELVRVSFDNPSRLRFALQPTVLVGPPNRDPSLDPIGRLDVFPGGRLELPLIAPDPDGDLVTFSIRSDAPLPTGMLEGDGTLVFAPTPAEIGTYNFTVVASDGAQEATQPVTLNVNADPVTTTRVSGTVLDVDGTPLASMQVEIGAVQGLTQNDGSFTLDLGPGPVVSDTLKIRGETFPGLAVYPFIAEKLPLLLEHDVFPGVNNVISRPIFLPQLDVAEGVQIDPMQDTMVTTAAIPGASLFVAAGTLMNQQGTPFTGVLSISEVPTDLTPAALPANLHPDLVVTIQPGEMVFAAPAPISFPNRAGYAPGTVMNLWSINPVTGQFDDVGDMRVSADGQTIDTISGGVRNSSWHFPEGPDAPNQSVPRFNADPNAAPTSCQAPLTSTCELFSGACHTSRNLCQKVA